jgi:hypothetical protein
MYVYIETEKMFLQKVQRRGSILSVAYLFHRTVGGYVYLRCNRIYFIVARIDNHLLNVRTILRTTTGTRHTSGRLQSEWRGFEQFSARARERDLSCKKWATMTPVGWLGILRDVGSLVKNIEAMPPGENSTMLWQQ